MGGHIAVFEDRIEIHRHGLLHMVLEILNLYEGSTDITIPIDRITSIAIIDPWLEPGYIRFSYAGSPTYTKHYWEDAMTPNTLLMGYFDTRDFHRLREYLLARQADVDADTAMARMNGDRAHGDHGEQADRLPGTGEHAREPEPEPEPEPPSQPMPSPEMGATTADWPDRYRVEARDRYYVRDWRPEE